MNKCREFRDMFVEALYEDLPSEKQKLFDRHLQQCEKCASEYKKMEETLKVMDKKTRPDMDPDFWDDYWGKLESRIKKEYEPAPKPVRWWNNLGSIFNQAPRWAFHAVAAMMLIVVGIFIGREFFSPGEMGIQPGQQMVQAGNQAQDLEFVQRTQNYLQRSKIVLLGLVNFDPETEDPYGLNLPYRKQLSRELANEAKIIRAGLENSRQRQLQELVSDLEVILLQIANLESEHDMSAIEFVKEGVESRGIMLKINLTEIRRSRNLFNEPGSTTKTQGKNNKF
jgi:hypothetical protein